MAIPSTLSDNFAKTDYQMVSPEMMKRMQQYAVKLRKKHPTWKPEKLARKICTEFNVTPIKNEASRIEDTNRTTEKDSGGK